MWLLSPYTLFFRHGFSMWSRLASRLPSFWVRPWNAEITALCHLASNLTCLLEFIHPHKCPTRQKAQNPVLGEEAWAYTGSCYTAKSAQLFSASWWGKAQRCSTFSHNVPQLSELEMTESEGTQLWSRPTGGHSARTRKNKEKEGRKRKR